MKLSSRLQKFCCNQLQTFYLSKKTDGNIVFFGFENKNIELKFTATVNNITCKIKGNFKNLILRQG